MDKKELGKTGGEPHPVSFKLVIPAMSKDEAKKLLLIEDQIGCKGLLTYPWSLKSEEMAREFS